VRGGSSGLKGEVGIEGIGGGNVGESRKIPGRGRQKCRRLVLVSRAAVIGDRPDRVKTIIRSKDRANIGSYGGPREPGVKLVNSVKLPATDNLSQETVTVAEIRQVPN